MKSMIAVFVSAMGLAACSIWLPSGRQCERDEDCRLRSLTCSPAGLCVAADGDTSGRDGGVGPSTDAWVLAYQTRFHDEESDSLHLAYSVDGGRWTPLGEGRGVFSATGFGTGHIRDPHLFRRDDGSFVLVAADMTLAMDDDQYWHSPSPRVFVADSTDLVQFNHPRLLTLSTARGPDGDMGVNAPEAFYDGNRYGIVWSGVGVDGVERAYVTYLDARFEVVTTRDPMPLNELSGGARSPTFTRYGGMTYLFYTDLVGGVRVARSSTGAPGTFDAWSQRPVEAGAFGGALVLSGSDQWLVTADVLESLSPASTWRATTPDVDPETWRASTPGTTFYPRDAGQGGAVRVTMSELDALIAHYGSGFGGVQLRTGLTDASAPQYVVHSDEVVLGPIGIAADDIDPVDFRWTLRPALSDPTNPELVSIESASRPGLYWRVSSASPDTWPAGTSGRFRDAELSNVPVSRRHHLVRLERPEASDTAFAMDATFRRETARNGSAGAISLSWARDTTLFVGALGFHLVVQTADSFGSNDLVSLSPEE